MIRTLFILPFIIFLLSGCNNHGHDHDHDHDHDHSHDHDHEHEHPDEIVFTVDQAEASGLKTIAIAPGSFHEIIKTSGQIQAAQGDETTIIATTSGTVSFTDRSIANGSPVKAGESIVTISAKNIQEGDPSAKAKIEYEAALAELQRAENLIKDKIISEKDFQLVRLRFENAKTVFDAQAGNVTAQGIRVTSPINGFIKSRLVSQGEYVSVGQPIAVVSQNRTLQLKAEVSEKHYRSLKGLTTAHFKMAYDTTVYKLSNLNGRLLSFGKTTDASSFYIPVVFEFDNKGEILPGSFTEIFLISAPQQEVIAVPLSAITEEQGLHFVYLRIGEEVYRKQEVQLGHNDGERVLVVDGLSQGDELVTKGAYQVKIAANASIIPEGHTH